LVSACCKYLISFSTLHGDTIHFLSCSRTLNTPGIPNVLATSERERGARKKDWSVSSGGAGGDHGAPVGAPGRRGVGGKRRRRRRRRKERASLPSLTNTHPEDNNAPVIL